MTMTRFSSPAQIVKAYRSNSQQFWEMERFERLSAKVWHGDEFQRNPSGRMVIVPVGNELYVIPHSAVWIDAVSYHDTGYKMVFDCPRYKEGCGYNHHGGYEMVSPALLMSTGENTYVVATKGVLRMK